MSIELPPRLSTSPNYGRADQTAEELLDEAENESDFMAIFLLGE